MKENKLRGWLTGSLVVCSFALFWLLERRRPLRQSVESKLARTSRNLGVAALAGLALRVTESPMTTRLTALVEKRSWGVLKLVRLPRWLETALALLLMDYTLYLWHVLMHRVPFLWRFHLPHHVDLDLDTSTALRFHFGELALASAWRAGQITLIGVSPLSLAIWQALLMLSILFHHSNVRLPIRVEQALRCFVVTPRLHGIHHSMVKEETNSNWSSGLTVWDRLHGTLKFDIPQDRITIGVPAYRDPDKVNFVAVLKMPFVEQPPTWLLPGDGQPARTLSPGQQANEQAD